MTQPRSTPGPDLFGDDALGRAVIDALREDNPALEVRDWGAFVRALGARPLRAAPRDDRAPARRAVPAAGRSRADHAVVPGKDRDLRGRGGVGGRTRERCEVSPARRPTGTSRARSACRPSTRSRRPASCITRAAASRSICRSRPGTSGTRGIAVRVREPEDWEQFRDPRATTYSRYTSIQAAKEVLVDALFDSIERDAPIAAATPRGSPRSSGSCPPLRYLFHGLQMAACYVGQMAPSGRIAICAMFQAADEMRRLQRFAYRMALLRRAVPGFGDGARELWEDHPAWQGAREAVERLLATYDWGEAFVALDLVLKPRIDDSSAVRSRAPRSRPASRCGRRFSRRSTRTARGTASGATRCYPWPWSRARAAHIRGRLAGALERAGRAGGDGARVAAAGAVVGRDLGILQRVHAARAELPVDARDPVGVGRLRPDHRDLLHLAPRDPRCTSRATARVCRCAGPSWCSACSSSRWPAATPSRCGIPGTAPTPARRS